MDSVELDDRFTYHPPTEDKVFLHQEVRETAAGLAHYLNDILPESREKSLAITHLEEVVFWANAAIARNA